MTGSVALDVVIGLVFVYTLYSLLTTTVTEFVATWIRLRSLFLIRGIERMLDDGSGTTIFSTIFMNQPLIKYLTTSRAKFFKAPAYMSAANFSKNLFETLKIAYPLKAMGKVIARLKVMQLQNNVPDLKDLIVRLEKDVLENRQVDEDDLAEINDKLKNLPAHLIPEAVEIDRILKSIESYNAMTVLDRIREVLDPKKNYVGKSETIRHIRSLLEDSNNDLEKFKAHLEQWYDDTMERVTGWYKKWTQVITFFVGLLIAIFFNADTILIADRLSKDPTARNQIVQMASTYIANHPNPPSNDTSKAAIATRVKLDSLMNVTKEIRKDVESANATLGLGWDFPDKIPLLKPKDGNKSGKYFKVFTSGTDSAYIELTPVVTEKTLHYMLKHKDSGGRFTLDSICGDFVMVSCSHFFFASFFGYLLTAIALSLGAPFWFDLLNKLMKLRTSVQATPSETSSPSGSIPANGAVPATKRHG